MKRVVVRPAAAADIEDAYHSGAAGALHTPHVNLGAGVRRAAVEQLVLPPARSPVENHQMARFRAAPVQVRRRARRAPRTESCSAKAVRAQLDRLGAIIGTQTTDTALQPGIEQVSERITEHIQTVHHHR